MTRPSRGLRESTALSRKNERFFRPNRFSRNFTAIRQSLRQFQWKTIENPQVYHPTAHLQASYRNDFAAFAAGNPLPHPPPFSPPLRKSRGKSSSPPTISFASCARPSYNAPFPIERMVHSRIYG